MSDRLDDLKTDFQVVPVPREPSLEKVRGKPQAEPALKPSGLVFAALAKHLDPDGEQS